MRLQIEYSDNKFLDADFDSELYITGNNQKLLWQIYRSFFFYKQRIDNIIYDVYGDNGIEIRLDEQSLSKKHNNFFFIDSRNSIYQHMTYQKNSLLFSWLDTLKNDSLIAKQIEQMNNELYKLNFKLQNKLDFFANNITLDFADINFLDLLKNNLRLGYIEKGQSLPLNFMSTEELMDEYINLLGRYLMNNQENTWLIIYNLESYLSKEKITVVIKNFKKLIKYNALKVVYITNDLTAVPLNKDDISNLIIVNKNIEQLPPFDILKKSISYHYPNKLNFTNQELVSSIKILAPIIDSKEDIYLRNKDMVLLKVMDQLLETKTLASFKEDSLTTAETEFLKDL